MSRHFPSSAYGYRVDRIDLGTYRISWVVDRFAKGSRLRYPTTYSRLTDRLGAIKFAKRHNCNTAAL